MTTKSPEGTSTQSTRYMSASNPHTAAELRERAKQGLPLNRAERRKLKRSK